MKGKQDSYCVALERERFFSYLALPSIFYGIGSVCYSLAETNGYISCRWL